ncbi:tyrosine-type recombinase/integrase [Commensalibacter nepenthis]|uniref:Integrase arm-type DNA-binding domain-containing protein n=1 Tax=Commensalibacter nepenthis TaxID=3043872 RepID=A0ABT6Q5P9_9PROT|nr:integrase arm-type DNA-binding domain-containing protein [Commensalibacter sp. TBRC 10068]MDI2112217.1 integrase arm-type DNA-binding domain-containing protein [Commensalibacter sp. TBRC 10068]
MSREKRNRPLTDKDIKSFKPRDKEYLEGDTQSLYLIVKPNGSKLWSFRYRFNKKQKELSLGAYPLVTLAQARQARDDAKREIADGIDPSITKKQRKAIESTQQQNTFKNVARLWWDTYKDTWTTKHAHDVINSLEKKIFPYFGNVVIHNITTPLIYEVLEKMEEKGTIETAQRIRQRVEAVFNYAIARGVYTEANPAASLKNALKKVIYKKKQLSISTLPELQEMMKVIDQQESQPVTKLAYRFLSIVFTRPGEVRGMRWSEIDGDVWTIPAARMKMKRLHKVYLSRQALEILEVVKRFSGNSPFVFPSHNSHFKPMSENAMGYLINRAGYQNIHCPHGFRASFFSIMVEKYPQDEKIIDLMLAHEEKNKVVAAYNRAEHSERRKELYQIYADMLFEDIVPVIDLLSVARKP